MVRQSTAGLRVFRSAALLTSLVTAALSTGYGQRAHAQGLTYVEADELAGTLTPLSAIDSNTALATDNKWGFRGDGGGAKTVFESSAGAEDSPELTQTISGLTPGASYEVYVAYWTDTDENWTIRAGLAPGVNTLYNFSGNFGAAPQAGAIPGITAAAVGAWDVLPPQTQVGGIFTDGPIPVTTPPTLPPGPDPFDRSLLLGKAGTTTANGAGEINVYIDDLPIGGAGRRSWLDGVAYRPASAAPISLTATLDANTGALTLTNPTSTAFQIKSYTVASGSGSLNATTWTPIAGNRDGAGNGSFDADLWQVTAPATPATTPWTTQLAEAETPANNGGTLAAGGGSISFGNVYRKNRFQDVQIHLTLADASVVSLIPSYTGMPIDPSDFNVDGSVTSADYQILMTNIHTNVSTFTQGQSHGFGDTNGDRVVNFNDFSTFRAAYDALNGVGSFAQMAAQVPEPTIAAMLLAAGVLTFRHFRGRLSVVLALMLCGLCAGSSQAQTLLKVDMDDRETVRDSLDVGNTVAGFQQFQLSGTPVSGAAPAVATTTTLTLAGYDVSVTPVNAAGVATSGVDDRDRATPTTTPTHNQLYDDFIFTATGVGANGGIDLTVQGGALEPNKPYAFSLYSFDSGSTGVVRTANWLDGNRGDILSFSTSFAGATNPTTDDQYKFTGVALSDGSGRLFMRGRNTTPLSGATINPGVFVNGFEINPFTGLTLEVNTTTGAIRLLNEQTSSIDLSYYEIRSAVGSLNSTGWASLDDGEGGDPVGSGWDEAAGSSANILSEGNLTSMLSLAGSGGAASLGSGFTLAGAQDLSFSYAAPGAATLQGGFVKYVTGGGSNADYDDDSDVDGQDFLLWQRQLGSTVPNGTGADGSGNGVVDAPDLALWRTQFGTTPATPAAAAVPEPATMWLLAFATGSLLLGAKRRP